MRPAAYGPGRTRLTAASGESACTRAASKAVNVGNGQMVRSAENGLLQQDGEPVLAVVHDAVAPRTCRDGSFTSSGVPRKAAMEVSSGVEYMGIWRKPGMTSEQ